MDDPAKDSVLSRDMALIAAEATARLRGMQSLLLGGSFARGEGSFVWRDGRWLPYKDYDLFAIVDDHRARAAAAAIPGLRCALYRRLHYAPYDERQPSPGQFHIGLAVIPRAALARLPHDLSNAELKLAGRVIWGEDLRHEIRSDPRSIPPVSGLRPVLNKLIGLVEQWGKWVDDETSPGEQIALAVAYDRAKAVLDLAAALLLLRGGWTAGYAARNRALREREANGPLLAEVGCIASRAEEALAFKLRPVAVAGEDAVGSWRDARDDLLRVVEPLAAAVLGYTTGGPLHEAWRFAEGARIEFLRPFAEHAVARYRVPRGADLAPWIVRGYAAWENLRLGAWSMTHPLIRAWSAAWAWLAASTGAHPPEPLLAWAQRMVGTPGADRETLRERIVALFKASSTARRRKRTL